MTRVTTLSRDPHTNPLTQQHAIHMKFLTLLFTEIFIEIVQKWKVNRDLVSHPPKHFPETKNETISLFALLGY